MRIALTISILSVVTFISIWLLLAYVNSSLTHTKPAEQLEKKGRAQYLIDTRWPFINVQALFGKKGE